MVRTLPGAGAQWRLPGCTPDLTLQSIGWAAKTIPEMLDIVVLVHAGLITRRTSCPVNLSGVQPFDEPHAKPDLGDRNTCAASAISSTPGSSGFKLPGVAIDAGGISLLLLKTSQSGRERKLSAQDWNACRWDPSLLMTAMEFGSSIFQANHTDRRSRGEAPARLNQALQRRAGLSLARRDETHTCSEAISPYKTASLVIVILSRHAQREFLWEPEVFSCKYRSCAGPRSVPHQTLDVWTDTEGDSRPFRARNTK